MRVLADENVERPIVDAVRALGHDVTYVSEMAHGTEDGELLGIAEQEQRVLITSDKDFGELVYLRGRIATGVLLLRFRTEKSSIKTIGHNLRVGLPRASPLCCFRPPLNRRAHSRSPLRGLC